MLKLYTTILLLVSLLSYAQTDLLIKIPLEEQVSNAQLIAEGEIIAKKSYWDVGRKIYTVNTLESVSSTKEPMQQELVLSPLVVLLD